MLKFYTHSDLYQLAESLHKELANYPAANPLAAEQFVVQNHGMTQWLSQQLAEKEGIAANLDFKFPAELFWQLVRVMNPDISEVLPSERDPMAWAVFYTLQNDDGAALSVLHQYVNDTDPQKKEIRCWSLARRISDVFDQYLTYRPEMLLGWEDNRLTTDKKSEQWQAVLWRKLVKHWSKSEKGNNIHRAALQKQLITAIRQRSLPMDKLSPRISVFGVTAMPPVFLRVLIHLSSLTDVHFYLTNMTVDYDHALIQSLGKAGREFQQLVKKFNPDNIKLYHDQLSLFKKGRQGTSSLFEAIKADLLDGKPITNSISPSRSIQVHSCHSPRREVEVLYGQLLHLLDKNEDLNPSDIFILSPQIETYTPEIEAVFGTAEEHMPQIPWHLSEGAAASQNVDSCFIKLLDIIDSRFKVTEILDLLSCKPVCSAFSFSNEDINTLEKWIDDTRIRWGIDAQQKETLELPGSSNYTWQSGLHRMVAGYAMEAQKDTLFEAIYPYDEIQQSEHAQLLGRFSHFMHQLFQCRQQAKQLHTPAQWSRIFNEWLEQFFSDEKASFSQVQWLREMMNDLETQTSQAAFNDEVSYPVLRNHFKTKLDQKHTGGGRPGRGVTFSSMVSMRNIPAKVIGCIGMDDGVFPRPRHRANFDLIASNPRAGDRLPGKDDRQLFLECIIAARKGLYFSYVGQSNRKEVEFPPSVVLRELIDHIIEKYQIEEKDLIYKHPLQAFSPAYFKQDNKNLFSYSGINKIISDNLTKTEAESSTFFKGELPEPEEAFKSLSAKGLISFFQHPAKFLMQQRLGVHFRDEAVIDEDCEPFKLNGLEKYNLGQDLLGRFLNSQPLKGYKEIAQAQNLLPEDWPGQDVFNCQVTEVKQFGHFIEYILDQEKLEPKEIDCKLNDFRITGRLDQIYRNEQLLYRFGQMRPKDLIELWVKHLLFQAVKPEDHSGRSMLITRDKKSSVAIFELSPCPDARNIISDLLEIYWKGLQGNTLFFPHVSFEYAQAVLLREKSEQKALQTAERKWLSGPYDNYAREGDDPYNKRIMENNNLFGNNNLKESFKDVSRTFWEAFFKHLTTPTK